MSDAPMSGLTLALDASTYRGSVAVLDGASVRADAEAAMRGADAERLMPAVMEVLARAGVRMRDVTRVVCGAGPGSFTSLRIAAGIAKGVAMGLGCPLYAVPSLPLVVAGAPLPAGRYLVVLDAMRGERYAAPVDVADDGGMELAGATVLLAEPDVAALAAREQRTRVGPAEALEAWPRAAGVARMLQQVLDAGPCDLAAWQPDYGRLAEAQVKWEAAHGRALPAG